MGFFSSIFKVVKKVVKGAVHLVSSVLKSPIGKIALAAAAIYTGGVALGAFGASGAVGASTIGAGYAAGASTISGITSGLEAASITGGAAATAAEGLTVAGAASASSSLFGGLSTLDTITKIGKVASAANSVAGLLGGGQSEYNPNIKAAGATSAPDTGASVAAAQAAADQEAARKRKGTGAAILTSPLGLVGSGQSQASALLG